MKNFAKIAVPLPINKLFTYEIPEELISKVSIGKRCVVPFGKQETIGYIIDFENSGPIPSNIKKIKSVIDETPVFDDEILGLAKYISDYYLCSLGEALNVSVSVPVVPQDYKFSQDEEYAYEVKDDKLVLTLEQQASVDVIINSVKNGKKDKVLIYGVTGSGKTEVYIRAIEYVVSQGRTAIVLVPEISLTPQIVERFKCRFKGKVGVWHSRLTKKQRMIEFLKISNGETKIIIGARSAIFTPIKNIGIIIIDEEHENTYKQEETPRYHLRNVAIKRAELNSAVVVFGSATPSIETYFKAVTGEFKLCTLLKRVDKKNLPEVKVIDMNNQSKETRTGILSEELRESIKDRLSKKEQVMLFLNRRGFSTFVLCKECGYTSTCPHCSVSLTYHIKDNLLRCHYCSYKEHPPLVCPKCKGTYIKYLGKGTQKVESEIKMLFPEARILRMDADVTRKKDSFMLIFKSFQNRDADILIGTQMIVKGFDFPYVTLVGIISADTSLIIPDFRSGERTFQLVTQAAGRSGRGDKKGEVIVQTYKPDYYSITAAISQNYIGFYSTEIIKRKEVCFPPFSSIINIIVKGSDEKKVIEKANELNEMLIKQKVEGIEVFGPSSSPLAKIDGKYRWHLILKGNDINKLLDLIKSSREKIRPSFGLSVSIDVDPVSLM